MNKKSLGTIVLVGVLTVIGILYLIGLLIAGRHGKGIINEKSIPAVIYWPSISIFMIVVMLTAYSKIIEFFKLGLKEKLRIFFNIILYIAISLLAIFLLLYFSNSLPKI
jgi:hypothetical protein